MDPVAPQSGIQEIQTENLGPLGPLMSELFEQAPGFFALLEGPSHVFRLTNGAYRALIGEREHMGLSVKSAFPELQQSGYLALLDTVFATRKPFVGKRMPLRFSEAAASTTSLRFVDFVYQPFVGRNGETLGICVQGHDVTDLVLAEQALEAKVNQLALERTMFDTALSFSEDFNYLFDVRGRFQYVNKSLLALWGLGLEDVVGKTFFQLPYETQLAQRLQEDIETVVRTKAGVRGETFYRSPTGVEAWYEYRFNPVFDLSNNVTSVAGSTSNVTSRIEQERKLVALMDSERVARLEAERASRVKDEFIATMSHELRTPINSILGWTALLRSGRLSAEKTTDALDRIYRNAKGQSQLISDLLDVNATALAKTRLHMQRLPLIKPLSAALDSAAPEAARRRITMSAPSGQSTVLLECDPDRLQQVFWNLLNNALKFTPDGGSVTVSVEADSEHARIAIRDTGCGIAAAFLPHVFERFRQADGSSTRGFSGLGLGLFICKTLVEMHGGSVEASSAGVGHGATLSVTLPLRNDPPHAPLSTWGDLPSTGLPTNESAKPLQSAAVLVVDDDVEGRAFVAGLLSQYGAAVSECSGADEAIAMLAQADFALMICDVGMPGKDGFTLMREIRASARSGYRLPAIALTAFARPQDEQSASEAGFDAYLSKPAEPASIIESCVRVLRWM